MILCQKVNEKYLQHTPSPPTAHQFLAHTQRVKRGKTTRSSSKDNTFFPQRQHVLPSNPSTLSNRKTRKTLKKKFFLSPFATDFGAVLGFCRKWGRQSHTLGKKIKKIHCAP